MRLFLAIDLPEEPRNHLRGVITYLQTPALAIEPMSWVRPENLHITLKFYGEVEPTLLDELRAVLATVRMEPLSLVADRIERFPPVGPCRVLAAGVGGDRANLCRIFEQIDVVCGSIGFAREKRDFTPHITLGRSRRGLRRMGKASRDDLTKLWPGPGMRVSNFLLVKSTVTSIGSVYETIATFDGK